MIDNDNVVPFKERKTKPIFREIRTHRHSLKCQHGNFKINEPNDTVECGLCGEILSPMWVLKLLANKNSQAYWQWHDLLEQVKKTRNKMRCKCQHCGKMTAIQR